MITDRYSWDEAGRPLLDGRPLERRKSEVGCTCGMARYRVARAAHRAARRFRGGASRQCSDFTATLDGAEKRCFTRHYYAQLAKEATR